MLTRPRPRTLALLCAVGCSAALVAATLARSEPAGIQAKRAEAQQVLDQIRSIDSELDQAVERYNQATIRLDQIEANLAATERRLGIAKKASGAAQRNLQRRVVALYQNGEQSVLEVVLGSVSLDDLLEAVDAAQRVSEQDEQILGSVQATRQSYMATLRKLRQARAEQRKVVASREPQKAAINAKLEERQRLYDSISDEIAVLEEQERRRQAQLAAEAQRRLEQQEAAASEAEAGPRVASAEVVGDVPAARYGGVVGIALSYLGVPYSWGGASPSGFDCSGFVMYVFAQIGVSLPHSTYALYGMGVGVAQSQLEPGDLVFFDGLGHMGIYIGGGQFVHAPHTGDVVKISSIYDSWYAATYVGARRLT